MKIVLARVEIVEAFPYTLRVRIPERSAGYTYALCREDFGDTGQDFEEGDVWQVWMDTDAPRHEFPKNMRVQELLYREK